VSRSPSLRGSIAMWPARLGHRAADRSTTTTYR
jgi:hypothetical protein